MGNFYRQRRDNFIRLVEQHLGGLGEWTVPTARRLCWIRLFGVEDTMKLIWMKAVEAKELLLSGSVFLPYEALSPYVRASFSTAQEKAMNTVLSRLRNLLGGPQRRE